MRGPKVLFILAAVPLVLAALAAALVAWDSPSRFVEAFFLYGMLSPAFALSLLFLVIGAVWAAVRSWRERADVVHRAER